MIEHLPNPKTDLNSFFASAPDVLLLSTVIYSGDSADWWYLSAESGQHVFFYSKAALELIAQRYGYVLLVSGGFQLYIKRNNSPFRLWLVKSLLKERFGRFAKSLALLLPTPGVWKDYRQQVEAAKRMHQRGTN